VVGVEERPAVGLSVGGPMLADRSLGDQTHDGAGRPFDTRTAKSAKPFDKMSQSGLKRYDSVAIPLSVLGIRCHGGAHECRGGAHEW
jgi:hypothetical protein